MSTDKEFKILSIDGGGTKGLYSLYILNALERLYCLPDNKLLSDYFDKPKSKIKIASGATNKNKTIEIFD